MKTIKQLEVTMTCKVILLNVEVTDSVFKDLNDNFEISSDDEELSDTRSWLDSNIILEDAVEWEYVIEDFLEEVIK